jgi:hypothetical protein
MKVPISKGAICPNCDGLDLQVLVLHISPFKRPKQNTCVLIALNCPTCKTYFTNEHFLKQTTYYQIGDPHRYETLNPIEILNLINAPDPLPLLDANFNTFKLDSIVIT